MRSVHEAPEGEEAPASTGRRREGAALGERQYRIGEVVRLTGLSAPTIRYYEEEGLIRPAGRTSGNFRLYDDEAISRLKFIRRAKGMGLRLAEIAEILRAPSAAAERESLRHQLAHRLVDVRRQMEELAALEAGLQRLYLRVVRDDCACRHLGDCSCLPGGPDPRDLAELRRETEDVARGECGCHLAACACGC